MGSDHYCLRWNNHQNNLLGVFSQLLRDESLVDVTLACSEGHSIRAHKVVLSACSSYFQTLFVDHPSRHPIVILKDVRFSELRTLIDFMYKGEVNVEYCQLSALLKTAESLKVKGLAEMTRDYKAEPVDQPQPSPPPAREDNNSTRTTSPAASHNLRVCKMMPDHEEMSRPPSTENSRAPGSPISSNEALSSEMTPSVSGNLGPSTIVGTPALCQRLDSPISNEAVPGPSTLPPVQKVPLSLKKEADWGGGLEEKPNLGESSSDYSRHQHDSEHDVGVVGIPREDSPRIYHCMYCGVSFPHQSKLTRHILSHSLETLKFRELQHSSAMPSSITVAEPPSSGYPLAEGHYSGRIPFSSHEPPDPTDQPPTPMDLDLSEAAMGAGGGGGVVLCKFCGKSFPDVTSLIGHLPVHTGDRPFKCEFCGKAFKLRHHMKDHCRVHTGERPFRCSLCGKTFSRSTILKAHEKTHYPKYVRKFLSPSPLDTEEESPH